MNGNKNWYQSRGMIGSLVAFISILAGQFAGITISEAEQAELVELFLTGAGLVGSILAWVGRKGAKHSIRPIKAQTHKVSRFVVLLCLGLFSCLDARR